MFFLLKAVAQAAFATTGAAASVFWLPILICWIGTGGRWQGAALGAALTAAFVLVCFAYGYFSNVQPRRPTYDELYQQGVASRRPSVEDVLRAHAERHGSA